MASSSILQRLQAEFDSPPDCIEAIVALLEDGAPVQFVSRFRRDETGDPGEERVQAIEERLHFLQELENRKKAIRQEASARKALTDELQQSLDHSFDQNLLDDIFQSVRPRRRAAVTQAEEKGVGPLTLAIQHRQLGDRDLLDVAQDYISKDKGLPTPEAVLEATLIILADRFASDPTLRARFRDELSRGIMKATATAPDHRRAQRYQQFFDFEEPVRRISAPRLLALRRAEREGILQLQLCLPEDRVLEIFRERFGADLPEGSTLSRFCDLVFQYSYNQSLRQECEGVIRRRMKEKADRETVRAFTRNLRSQLMSPPLGTKKVLALRASSKTLWAVLLGEDGSVAEHCTMHLEGEETQAKATEWLVQTLRKAAPAGIAIPHGRRQGLSEKLIHDAIRGLEEDQKPILVPVDEAASAIYATSNHGRKALPGVEVGIRTAISLGRRLQDPLHELVGMDPRSLGLGQNLDEVHQGMLNRQLDAVIASCLAAVGTDINSAPVDRLAHVPGVGRERARRIADHRRKHGSFKTLAQLQQVDGVDEKAFRHMAGFLMVEGGDEPLDHSHTHPDDYELARRIAESRGVAVTELFGKALRDVTLADFTSETAGPLRVLGTVQGLRLVSKDSRGNLASSVNEGVHSLEDLSADMRLKGRITNLTEFGAFVDLGVGPDGLIHMSQIPTSRLRNPDQTLRVGEVLTVYVLNVDHQARKISLSMHKPRHLAEGRQPTLGERLDQSRGRARGRRGSEGEAVLSRAARVPEGRRRGRPGRRPKTVDRSPYEDVDYRGDRGRRRPGGSDEPRVFTVESELPESLEKGFKGELRSLAGLRDLLKDAAPKKADETEGA